MPRPPIPQLLDFLSAFERPVAELALALREIVLEEASEATETVYRTHTVAVWFGFAPPRQKAKMKDNFCYIATASRHVNLGFPYGASLPDPSRVLEGDGKRMRHVKFRSDRDLERPFVRRYIRAAMEQVAQRPVEIIKARPVPPKDVPRRRSARPRRRKL